jgi:cardiolipin synthase
MFYKILFLVVLLLAALAAYHALLNKRHPSAAFGWIAVCLLYPFLGPLLYFLFGINRVRTRARKLERRSPFRIDFTYEDTDDDSKAIIQHTPEAFAEIASISDAVSRRPLVGGNSIRMLINGEQAYPEMMKSIEKAERTLYLSTYIFETNETGRRFIELLSQASDRGVDVRVIIDGIGEKYSIPRAGTLLEKHHVRFARFLPPKLFPPSIHVNLRNHRKILISDASLAFVGGMNISDRHLAERKGNASRVQDVHFRIEGPVVSQVEHVFLEDWKFCTGDVSIPNSVLLEEKGRAFCRAIEEGPNEDLDKLSMILNGAVSLAKHRVLIMTPYFLPPREMLSALQAAALRGVKVNVILPSKNNLPFVHWATQNMLWELLLRGVRIFYQPPPFDHAKLFVVDDHYAQIGSANIDPRSLRLNFELAIEIFDRETVDAISKYVESKRALSKEISLKEIDSRTLGVRTRDALAWLFSPYL